MRFSISIVSVLLTDKNRHIQRIGSNLYLVAVDCEDYCSFYVEDLVNLNRAIARDQTKKKIYFSKLSKDFVMAFDEGRRLLALCGATLVIDKIIMLSMLYYSHSLFHRVTKLSCKFKYLCSTNNSLC